MLRVVLPLLLALATLVWAGSAGADEPKERLLSEGGLPEIGPNRGAVLVGKPIRAISIELTSDRFPDLPKLSSVKVGDILASDSARKLLAEALATGGFASGSVSATEDGPGVRIVVRLAPRRIVAKVKLTGDVLDRAGTLEAAGITEGGEITGGSLDEITRRIREHYAKRGYPASTVKLDLSATDKANEVVLFVEVKPGEGRKIDRRVFVIDPREQAEVGSLKDKYQVGSGARADEVTLTQADRELSDVLHAERFPKARVLHRVVERPSGKRTEAILFVYIQAGGRVELVFEGNKAYDADTLEQALVATAQRGEWSASDVSDRLRAYYVQRGFFDVEIQAKETEGDRPGARTLRLTIHEGDRVRVVHRVFPCLAGELSADQVGREIDGILQEELPSGDALSIASQGAVTDAFGGSPGRRAPLPTYAPAMVLSPEGYERAMKHVRDLFVSKGYLNAVIGPVYVIRPRCDPGSPEGECSALPAPEKVGAVCKTDSLGLPLPEPPVPETMNCKSDPRKGVRCSADVTLRIPIHLGPRTSLWDVSFDGNTAFTAKELSQIADLKPGAPLSALDVDAARTRIVDAYRKKGYAFVEVKSAIEPSPDRTRARCRFVLLERYPVIVEDFVVRGNVRTEERLIRARLSLEKEKPYRQDLARQSEERIATLGVFSSVSIALEDPQIPKPRKRVVVTVVEQPSQYLYPMIGFSSGDGLRFAFEYGHRNIGGLAIQLTLRIQLNFLFDVLILDKQLRENYSRLSAIDKLERRNSISLVIPDIGLGPTVALSLDGIDIRDNQRDFGLTREALIPTLTFRPMREVTAQLSATFEFNDVDIFRTESLGATFAYLRVPEGRTVAFSQRLKGTVDLRDNSLNATKGFFGTATVEHVYALPANAEAARGDHASHFMRLSGRVAGYIPFGRGISLALSIAAGGNAQIQNRSTTYPDRLFFLGGVDTVRAFLLDSVVPQDIAELVLTNQLSINEVVIRGGDLSLNPRAELRVPVYSILHVAAFLDVGNTWFDPKTVDFLKYRYALGGGIRLSTPAGPLAFDYGFNLDKRPWEDIGAFHFSVGLF